MDCEPEGLRIICTEEEAPLSKAKQRETREGPVCLPPPSLAFHILEATQPEATARHPTTRVPFTAWMLPGSNMAISAACLP